VSRWVRDENHVETLVGLASRDAVYDYLKESL
jgi:hypothetical protein